MTQRKEPLITPEKGMGGSENTLKGNEICTMTVHKINGLYKIFSPTTPGWGRAIVATERRVLSAFL